MFKIFKNKRTVDIILIIILIISTISYLAYNIFFREDYNSSYALSKYGSRSDEVKQIQTKLKRWGYYYGNVDGIYKDSIKEIKNTQLLRQRKKMQKP